MKTLALVLLTFLSIEAHSQIDAWKKQPEVPLPTLDHHLGKVTASIALYTVLRISGVQHSELIVSSAALAFETIQYLFFNETLRHSLNDIVLFSFHYPLIAAFEHKTTLSIIVTLNLTQIYLYLL